MSTTTTSIIALESLSERPAPQDEQELEHFAPAGQDTIIAASRLADSQAPDGGYGWVIIGACFVMTFWFVGTTYSWGIIQAALVKDNLSSPSTLSFVGSLTCSFVAFLAIINARVMKILGARNTAILGVSLLGGGFILSGFSTKNVGGLFFTSGIVEGVGASLQFIVVSTIPTQYFNKKRGIANGIVFGGGGLGGTIICFAMDFIIQKLGVEWTFRLLGLMTLITGLPAAWMIKERAPLTSPDFVEWKLFKNVRFVALLAAGAIGTFPLFVAPFFLPLYTNSMGLSASAGAGLVAGFNFSSAVGRILTGFMADKLGPVNTLFLSLMLSAISMLAIWPVSNTLAPLIVFIVINGAANGGFFSTMPTVVGSLFGSRRVAVAMGMIVTGWAGGYLMGAPIAGYLLAAYGGEHGGLKAYRPAMYYAGGMAFVSASLVGILRINVSKKLLKSL